MPAGNTGGQMFSDNGNAVKAFNGYRVRQDSDLTNTGGDVLNDGRLLGELRGNRLFRELLGQQRKQRPERSGRAGFYGNGVQFRVKKLYLLYGILGGGKQTSGLFHGPYACFIQFNFVLVPQKQRNAESGFDILHRSGNGGLGYMQFFGSFRERSAIRESNQLFQFQKV